MATMEPPLDTLNRLIGGFQVSQAIHIAAVLGIADLLKDGPCGSDDLARETDTHSQGLYRLLRALASVGVFEERQEETFALTPISRHLLSDDAESIRDWAVLIGQDYFWRTWGNLMTGIRTGENVFPQISDGMSVWKYREARPELNAAFNAAMTSRTRGSVRSIVQTYDFSGFKLVVDVGGSRGALLAEILRASPSTRGVNFDQPHVVSDIDLKEAGVADRCELVGGDFFDSVPPSGDAYVMKSIIHDWTDEQSIAILKTVRRAMGPDAKLLVVELVIEPPNEGPVTKFLDLNMLALPGGQERTKEEFSRLYAAAGFRLTRVASTGPGKHCVIEGVPV